MKIPKIQYITRDYESISHAKQAKLMFENKIELVQIRMKNATENEIIEQSEEALSYALEFGGKLIINDSVEIASKVGAHGVHLGLKDLAVNEARKQLGPNFIIGGTANTLEDVLMQVSKGADYVGLGPYRFTTTKKNLSPIVGMEGYGLIMQMLKERNIRIPIVAVGGILLKEVDDIMRTGVTGVAISGDLFKYFVKEISVKN